MYTQYAHTKPKPLHTAIGKLKFTQHQTEGCLSLPACAYRCKAMRYE